MMKRRLFSMIGTPLLALVAAGIYTEWRAARTALEVDHFCKNIAVGSTVEEFARYALAQGFNVNELGADSPNLIASKLVYSFKEEIYGCVAVRDALGRIQSTRTEHSYVKP